MQIATIRRFSLCSLLDLSNKPGSKLDLHPLALGLMIRIRHSLTLDGAITRDMTSTASLRWDADRIGTGRIGTGLRFPVAGITQHTHTLASLGVRHQTTFDNSPY